MLSGVSKGKGYAEYDKEIQRAERSHGTWFQNLTELLVQWVHQLLLQAVLRRVRECPDIWVAVNVTHSERRDRSRRR